MKIRNKEAGVKELVSTLGKSEVKIWKAVALKLNRPRRARFEVNLYNLDKKSGKSKTVVVPGIVLGIGEITKPLNVAALKFSKTAKEKIEKAGGKCMEISELVGSNEKGIKIMG